MNVLYAVHHSQMSGATCSLLDLLEELDKNEVRPFVVMPKHGPLEDELKRLGVKHFVVPYAQTVKGKETKYPLFAKKIANVLAVKKISKMIENLSIDLVHSNSISSDVGMRAAVLAEKPYICHIRDMIKEDHEQDFVDSKRLSELLNKASRVIYISEFVKNKFATMASRDNGVVLFNGVRAPSKIKDRGIFDGETVNLCIIGRIARGKQQMDAIRAVQILSDCGFKVKLTVAGYISHEDYYEECKAFVKKNKLQNIKFIEFTKEVDSIYQDSDIALMCSRAEAMGRVTGEGMMNGCLVIGANAGATPEILEHKYTGLLYESENSEDLAEKIVWATKSKETAREIADRGREFALKKFDLPSYSQKITNLYREALIS